jgi:hypothetical protein
MRDDLLKEGLQRYARDGAERASQPAAAAIHRRARRHRHRVAALSVAGVLLAVGLGVGLGVSGAHRSAPTVNQPPAPPSTIAPTTTTRGIAAGQVPETFVADLGGRVAVLSTGTGKVVRTLRAPSAGTSEHSVGLSPDRNTVYFSSTGASACDQPGIFRVPFYGGPAVRVVANETAVGPIASSADGSRLAYVASACPDSGRNDVVLRDANGALLHRWSGMPAGAGSLKVSLSPDGGQLAVTVFDGLDPAGVRVLDAAGASVDDGRLLESSDPGCRLVNAAFQPRTGRLAAFERCLPKDLQSGVPRFRLVYLDPASGRLLSRSLAFDDHTGGDLHVSSLDFDQSGRYLLYSVSSADPVSSQQPRPATGTWWSGGGRPVRIHDDQRDPGSSTGYLITSAGPSW